MTRQVTLNMKGYNWNKLRIKRVVKIELGLYICTICNWLIKTITSMQNTTLN